jgi:cytochrome c oxidase subunit 3
MQLMVSSSKTIEKSPVVGYNRGGFAFPPNDGGGWDGDGGDSSPDYERRLRRARLGLILATAPILMLFLTFATVLVIRRGTSTFDERTNTYGRDWIRVALPTGLLLINTLVLFTSSITVEVARRLIARDVTLSPLRSIPGILIGGERGFPWLAATALLGTAFLWGQWMAWRELLAKGFSFASGASSSFVYLLTATHAVHLVGGLLVLLYAVINYFLHRPVESRHIVVDVTAWYWHFMLFLWIGIFVVLEVMR